MSRVNVMAARKAFSETIDRVAFGKERIVLERRGKDVAALISVEELKLFEKLLDELEDRRDVEEAERRLADEEDETIPYEQARRELGFKDSTYRVEIKRSAQKEIDTLPSPIKPRLDAAIRALAENPRPRGYRKLEGTKTKRTLYRMKVAVYRVIYEVRDELLLVVVVRVRHRRDAYRLPFPTTE